MSDEDNREEKEQKCQESSIRKEIEDMTYRLSTGVVGQELGKIDYVAIDSHPETVVRCVLRDFLHRKLLLHVLHAADNVGMESLARALRVVDRVEFGRRVLASVMSQRLETRER